MGNSILEIPMSGKLIALVKVPSDSYDHKLSRDEYDEPTYISYLQKGTGNYRDGFDIPKFVQPEYYTIVGIASSLTDAQKISVLEKGDDGLYIVYGKVYEEPEHSRLLATTNVDKAFDSLLAAHGKKPSTTLIMLKNE